MVVTTTSIEYGETLAARLRRLVDSGWDARQFCRGDAWASDPALRDLELAPRIEFKPSKGRAPVPRELRRRPRELLRYLQADREPGPFDHRLLELRPELIHYHSGSHAWRCMRLRRLLGSRIVISFRNDGRDLEVPDPSLLWQADRFLFPDPASLERAVTRGCPAALAEVVPPPLTANADGHRPEAGPLRVLTVAPVTWEQGLEHSIHAVRLLLDRGVECEYSIVGAGDHMLAVAFARHQLGLTEQVTLISPDGGRPVMEELRRADVVLDPAVTDEVSTGPLAIAQARGIPFVATPRDGLRRDAGIVVPRRNPGAIADALATLVADPMLRERMGAVGRGRAGPYLTVEQDARRLEGLYWRVLA
jgi:glycosyltransferase involved in cell wall biosynthesis